MVLSKEKLFTKFVRAKAKTYYHAYKKDVCWVCGSTNKLELHHVYPLAELIKDYLKDRGIKNPDNNEQLREEIFNDVGDKIFNDENLITLCKMHHTNIHRLFGKTYNGKIAKKVRNFLIKQREKVNG